jgi:hypothetical protein
LSSRNRLSAKTTTDSGIDDDDDDDDEDKTSPPLLDTDISEPTASFRRHCLEG